jgi:hypothetical protein
VAAEELPPGRVPQGDRIKAFWLPVVRRIKEDLASARAQWAEAVTKNPTGLVRLAGEHLVVCFDVQASWSLLGVWSDGRISNFYEPYLKEALKETLKDGRRMSAKWSPRTANRARFISTLRLKLNARILHWKAEALKRVREIETSGNSVTRPVQSAGADQLQTVELTRSPDGASTAAASAGSFKPKRRAGKKANTELNKSIADVLRDFPAWQDRLDDVCEALDFRKVPLPPGSKKPAKLGWTSWRDALDDDREWVKKALQHRAR